MDISIIRPTPPSQHLYPTPLTLSIASGSIIQAKHIGKDIMAGLRIIVGGELTKYPKMLEEARAKAINRMVQDAKKM